MTDQPTISINTVKYGDLPADVTGVRWTDTRWTECVDHLTHPAWASMVPDSDEPTGIALHGPVNCDLCREAALWSGHRLHDYNTGDDLGPATPEQVEASTRAAEKDGGRGTFDLDGRTVYTAPPLLGEEGARRP